jgi:hypothetical protein
LFLSASGAAVAHDPRPFRNPLVLHSHNSYCRTRASGVSSCSTYVPCCVCVRPLTTTAGNREDERSEGPVPPPHAVGARPLLAQGWRAPRRRAERRLDRHVERWARPCVPARVRRVWSRRRDVSRRLPEAHRPAPAARLRASWGTFSLFPLDCLADARASRPRSCRA